MNRSSLRPPVITLVALCAVFGGCGGGSPAPGPDPAAIVATALSRASLHPGQNKGASPRVEVESLGKDGAVLSQRVLPVPPNVMTRIERILVTSPSAGGSAGSDQPDVIDGVQSGEPTTVGGVDVDHVSGEIDVPGLVKGLSEVAGDTSGKGSGRLEVPALARLEQLKDAITSARFDLYARQGDGSLEQADLTLSLDSGNALPPTRIRFRLSGIQPGKEN